MTQKQNAAMNQAIDLLINNDTDVTTLFKEDGLLKELTVIYQIKGTTKLHEKGTIIVIDKIVTINQ